jgi:S1-C subfamily serine protease
MARIDEVSTGLSQTSWREIWQRMRVRLKRMVPFAGGVAAALIAVYLYGVLNPPAEPLTIKEVNTAVAEAMAEATPAPAYSAQVYGVIQPSLVLIETTGKDESDTEHDGLGSGVVVSVRGEILTAFHVVDGATSIEVTFADGTKSNAQIAASQPEIDIAVLQPDRLPGLLIPAVMGNPNALRVGDEAFAVGNPFGLYGSMSSGVISGFDRAFRAGDGKRAIDGLIQIDTAVNPGNSGGPLLNRYGQVVGIVVGVLNPTKQDFFVGIGFAVPITTAASGAGAPPY